MTNNDDSIQIDTNDDELDYISIDDIKRSSYIRRRASPLVEGMDMFLKHNNLIVKTKETKNFWSRGDKKYSYNISDKYLPRFFQMLEQCRKKLIPMHITEYQYDPDIKNNKTGLYMDFDIKQKTKDILFTELIYKQIILIIAQQLCYILNCDSIKTIAGVTVRSQTSRDSIQSQLYKYGFHIIIPGIRVNSPLKKYIYHILNTQSAISSVIGNIDGIVPVENYIDVCSSWVPPLLIGSGKEGCKPYVLKFIYDINVIIHDESIIPCITSNTTLFNNEKFNAVYEFCITKYPKREIIPRQDYDCKPNIATNIVDVNSIITITEEDEVESDINELEHRNPEVSYIKLILDVILTKKNTLKWKDWNKLYNILATQGDNYKCLIKYVSMQTDEWQKYKNDLDDNWEKARKYVKNKPYYPLPSLYKWAKTLNSEEYYQARNRSIYNIMWDKITHPLKKGCLGDSDWAEILCMLTKDKYVSDYEPGDANKTWFEFTTKNDKYKDGEPWKWRKCNYPESLSRYISDKLPEFCLKIYESLNNQINSPSTEVEISTWLKEVKKKFYASVNKLSSHSFKVSIISESHIRFSKPGFAEKLDTNEMVLGIGQGLLVLDRNGNKEECIENYNDYNISRYTNTKYPTEGFNPRDPKTKRLLLAIRNMFPNNEASTHLFVNCLLASTLDGRSKNSLFNIFTGIGQNGKSFLLELHRNMLGDANVTGYSAKLRITTLTTPQSSGEGATSGLMQLKYARLAHYSESNEDDMLRTEIMRLFTGGESLAARFLHKNMQTFRPVCQHILTTNHPLGVDNTDHGTWRRLKLIQFKMVFCDPDDSTNMYDENNPHHRIGDKDLLDKVITDPEYISAWMSIMIFYHRILMKYFNGDVNKIYSEYIEKDTIEFRMDQDKITKFISTRIVEYKLLYKLRRKLLKKQHNIENKYKNNNSDEDSDESDNEIEDENIIVDKKGAPIFPLHTVIDLYKEWYDDNYKPKKHNINNIQKQFIQCNLLITTCLHKLPKGEGYILVGMKALKHRENLGDQIRLSDTITKKKKSNRYKYKSSYKMPPTENVDEYYNRVLREFDELNSSDTTKPVVRVKSLNNTYSANNTIPEINITLHSNKYINSKTTISKCKLNKMDELENSLI